MAGKGLRLLALDGGGIRGLSSLMILDRLLRTVDPVSPPKPCEYFDLIGGTSTGGLIAIMLGRLCMTVTECIDAYCALSARVFRKKAHRINSKGDFQGRFDSKELESAIKDVLRERGLPEDTLLNNEDAGCKVFVCATSKATSSTVCLKSYGHDDLVETTKIWEACRATSAASTFFDPIAIGPFGEEFVDGATGANNPVWELWYQAQTLWGRDALETDLICLISLGTGGHTGTVFRDDVLHIHKTLAAISTETEETSKRFSRDKPHLVQEGRYYRFNVPHGLDTIGLQESDKINEIAGYTRHYLDSPAVAEQMNAFAKGPSLAQKNSIYSVPFSLAGVPVINKFVDRPGDISLLEDALLPKSVPCQRQLFVLRGLGGMGKTQLAAAFARKHQKTYSAILWLDGSSETTLKRSIALYAPRIPKDQLSSSFRANSEALGGDSDTTVKEVLNWLSLPMNNKWLIIFDNVDRDHQTQEPDPDAYDVNLYFPESDHGSIFITTRLAKLEQLADAHRLDKVDIEKAVAIFSKWYGKAVDNSTISDLLHALDGLPLAIAQAAAYIRQTGVSFAKYLEFYKGQWKDLVQSQDGTGMPLAGYSNGSIWTTWTISYHAIKSTNPQAARLLMLWAHIDCRDLWFGLIEDACNRTKEAGQSISALLPEIAANEIKFNEAMGLLRNYSLAEELQGSNGYATHPVVHTWALHFQDPEEREQLSRLALLIVGFSVPFSHKDHWWNKQRRLLAHASKYRVQFLTNLLGDNLKQQILKETLLPELVPSNMLLSAIGKLAVLFDNQERLREAEILYTYLLSQLSQISETASYLALTTLGNLAYSYEKLGKIRMAEDAYLQVLQRGGNVNATHGYKTKLLAIASANLGDLYLNERRLDEAMENFQRALKLNGEHDNDDGHILRHNTLRNIGTTLGLQGKLMEAEEIFQCVLDEAQNEVGVGHERSLGVLLDRARAYLENGKYQEALEDGKKALIGYEKSMGPKAPLTITAVGTIGQCYMHLGKLHDAEGFLQRSLEGCEILYGPEATSRNYYQLHTLSSMGELRQRQGRLEAAQELYLRALTGLRDLYGPSNTWCKDIEQRIAEISPGPAQQEDGSNSTSTGSEVAKERTVSVLAFSTAKQKRRSFMDRLLGKSV